MGATIPAVVPPPTIPYQIPPCLRGVDPHVAMVDDHYLQQYIQQIRNCRSTIEAGLCFISQDDEVAVEQLMSHPRIKVKPWKPFASASVCEVNGTFDSFDAFSCVCVCVCVCTTFSCMLHVKMCVAFSCFTFCFAYALACFIIIIIIWACHFSYDDDEYRYANTTLLGRALRRRRLNDSWTCTTVAGIDN
jgi:hypothetical protein